MTRIFSAGWAATHRYRLVVALVVGMFVGFALTQPDFATETNIKNVLADSSILWIVAMGMTFVLLTGGFDLSVGATATFTGIALAKLIDLGLPGGVVLALVVLIGALIGGLLNGFLIGRLRLSMFVVTLATLTALTGVVNLWSGGDSFLITAPITSQIAVDEILGLPAPIWIMAAIFLLALYLQRYTYFGRDVYATGGSLPAARLAGIRVERTLMLTYALVGACAGLAGAIAVGRVGAATPTVDGTLALQAVAAALLGGTALTGGAGGVVGTAFGVLFIGILQNGLSLSGVSSDWQNVITGVILIVAVLGDRASLGALLRWARSAQRPAAALPRAASDPP
ncbi:MAG: ABC transporter permease [Solirubrobacterales bacterium]